MIMRRRSPQSLRHHRRRNGASYGEKESPRSGLLVSVSVVVGIECRYGHGKMEALGAMGIALFLMGTAVMIGWDSYIALQDILANNVVNDYGASNNFYTYLVGTFSPGHGRAVPACWASASWRRKRSTA